MAVCYINELSKIASLLFYRSFRIGKYGVRLIQHTTSQKVLWAGSAVIALLCFPKKDIYSRLDARLLLNNTCSVNNSCLNKYRI
jgi:hypothetical protein